MHHQETGSTTYTFGPFRFVPQRQLLLCDGLPVRIGGRALDILTLLVRRAGEVVSKNELLTFCWPSVYVEVSNLKVNVASLRRVLAGKASENFIATVPGRGYKFVAPVLVERVEGASSKALTRSKPILPPVNVIGRSDEIEDLAAKLQSSRCLTIVGPGGMGKTTISLALAHHLDSDFPDGVYFVDLSTVGDGQYAAAAIASGVGARQRSEDTISEIIALLHARKCLLILDNCEHLSPTIGSIAARLFAALPGLTVLATSREPLFVEHEEIHRLQSLRVPDLPYGDTAAEALKYSAIQLFVARANGRISYVLSDADAPAVIAICRRLDGIPLAIELAASKTFAYGVPTLLSMLEQRFLVLSNQERSAPLRQQTLLATLDWSYRLLADGEASLLRLLSVFAGSFTLQDAISISEAIGFDATNAIDGLERLASKSLVLAEHFDGTLMYRLLESTRAFAADKLCDAGERDTARHKHAWHTLALFERAAAQSECRDKGEWMGEYAHRIDDARNAMTWAFDPHGDQMLGVRLTAATIPLWYELSSLNEMQSRVERALIATRDIGDCPKELIMKLIAARATGMTFAQHLPLDTEAAWKECFDLGVESGDVKYQIFGLWGLCSYLIYTGRPYEGLAGLEKFIVLAQSQSDNSAVAEAHRMMATAEIYIGDIASAKRRLERLALQHRRITDPARFARFQAEKGVAVRCSLSLALWVSGDPCRGMEVARAAVERAEISGHVVSHSNALAVFALPLSFWSGDYAAAELFLKAVEENGRREDIGVWREVCLFFESALRAKRQEPKATQELKRRLDEMMEARHVLRAPMHFSMVAEAFMESGELEGAKSLAEAARNLAIEQDANWCLPEVLRVTGLIEHKLGNVARSEALLHDAVSEASKIGAGTFELKAAHSLAINLHAKGRGLEAQALLEAVLCKFRDVGSFPFLASAQASLQSFKSTIAVADVA